MGAKIGGESDEKASRFSGYKPKFYGSDHPQDINKVKVGSRVTVWVGNSLDKHEALHPEKCEVVAVNYDHRHYTVRLPQGYLETFYLGGAD